LSRARRMNWRESFSDLNSTRRRADSSDSGPVLRVHESPSRDFKRSWRMFSRSVQSLGIDSPFLF
jgi:hypothetical protein